MPTGSLPEEVRDDVDAKLSPGEFVIPADVVRFIGLERLMKMRDEAKKGLERMAAIGQMGNAEEVGEESNSTYEDEGFESEIDDILEEIEAEENDKGDVEEQTEKMMAVGGFIGSGTDITKAPKNPVFDVRYYKNDQGTVMYITHINGKPMSPVPEGFKLVTKEEAQKVGLAAEEAKKAEQKPAAGAGAVTGQEGPEAVAPPPSAPATSLFGMTPMQVGKVGETLGKIPLVVPQLISKGLTTISDQMAQTATLSSMGAVAEDAAAQAPQSPAVTGGMPASNAAVAAADAAINAGHSNAASVAAANAAATAINSGATPDQAAAIGAGAAAAVDAGADTSGNTDPTGQSDVVGGPFAKGGLVNRRQYPAKKKRGKGIIAQK